MSSRRLLLKLGAIGVVGATALAIASSGGNAQDPSRAIDASYPEGPLYVGDALYYSEMGADAVTVVENGAPRRFFEQAGCGPTAIAPYGDGFLLLCHIGRELLALSSNGRLVAKWTETTDGQAFLDPNDAASDGKGGVYFSDPGTFARDSGPEGRVIHISAAGSIEVVADGLWYPNGVFVDSSEGRLLVSEHLAGSILSFDIHSDGSLGPATSFAKVADAPRSDRYVDKYPEAGPDGLEMAPDGDVYVAVYGEGRILVFDRTGAFRQELTLSTRYVTNIAFSGDGAAATTGAFDNRNPPYSGEVRILSSDEF